MKLKLYTKVTFSEFLKCFYNGPNMFSSYSTMRRRCGEDELSPDILYIWTVFFGNVSVKLPLLKRTDRLSSTTSTTASPESPFTVKVVVMDAGSMPVYFESVPTGRPESV